MGSTLNERERVPAEVLSSSRQVEHPFSNHYFHPQLTPSEEHSSLSCNTFHCTSHSFSLIIWQNRGPAPISFYSENQKEIKRTGQNNVSLC